MRPGAPRSGEVRVTVGARPRSITHLSGAECRSGAWRGKQSSGKRRGPKAAGARGQGRREQQR